MVSFCVWYTYIDTVPILRVFDIRGDLQEYNPPRITKVACTQNIHLYLLQTPKSCVKRVRKLMALALLWSLCNLFEKKQVINHLENQSLERQ